MKLYPVAILAGGLATRMRPLTVNTPKSMLSIDGVPFIAYQLELLRRHGFQKVVICIGHLGDSIQKYVGNGSRWNLSVAWSYDGETLMGTGGAIRNALPLLGNRFFVLYGDSYLCCPYAKIQEAFSVSGKPGLMTVYRNNGRLDVSNVHFEEGKIIAYNKKNPIPAMCYVDYGVGLLESFVFENLPSERVCDLADIYSRMASCGELAGVEVTQRFYEIGSRKGLCDFKRYITQRQSCKSI